MSKIQLGPFGRKILDEFNWIIDRIKKGAIDINSYSFHRPGEGEQHGEIKYTYAPKRRDWMGDEKEREYVERGPEEIFLFNCPEHREEVMGNFCPLAFEEQYIDRWSVYLLVEKRMSADVAKKHIKRIFDWRERVREQNA